MFLRTQKILRTTWATSYLHASHDRSAELKASIKLIAEIRKITDNQTSFAKAKEALLATQNDLNAALSWLEKDAIASGAKKAAKVASRVANDGLVGIVVLADGGAEAGSGAGSGKPNPVYSVRAAMVEVNCETDFVARNDIFARLVTDIAHTTAFLAEAPSSSPSQVLSKTGLITPFPVDLLSSAPLISAPSGASPTQTPDPSRTISTAIQETIAKVGEKISLRRACSFVGPALPPTSRLGLRVGTYIHLAGSQPQTGKIGALVALALKSKNLSGFDAGGGDSEIRAVGRALARQVVGLGVDRVQGDESSSRDMGDASSTALYEQPFMMSPGGATDTSVRAALNIWAREKGLVSEGESGGEREGLEVLEFVKWTAGEGIERLESEGWFAEEVRRLSS
ncbi:hypothetical protein BDV93DRAFT_525087 [Ceratobasidium sp. AG-I]|nr:hypothetical protein BDV93DRAFT_525087 [Ceratobasidium sp. AG-I]